MMQPAVISRYARRLRSGIQELIADTSICPQAACNQGYDQDHLLQTESITQQPLTTTVSVSGLNTTTQCSLPNTSSINIREAGSLLQGVTAQRCHVRCLHTDLRYSARTGTPKPTPWPVINKVPTSEKTPGQLRWQRTVLRPDPEVQVQQDGTCLILSGRAGSVKVDLASLDPTGLVAYKILHVPNNDSNTSSSDAPKERVTVIVASPDEDRFQTVVKALDAAFQGVMQGYMVALTVKGVGYRLEPVDDIPSDAAAKQKYYFEKQTGEAPNIQYPYNKPVQALRLRVGYSRPVIYPLPSDVRGFCIKPTLFYLYGLDQGRLNDIAQDIKAIRKPSVYTGNGIQIVGEVLRQKQRSSRKGK